MIINGLNVLKAVPGDQQISISYESFVENPGFQLRRLIDFIDPELESENWIKNQLKILHKGSSNWEQLDDQQIKRLTDACREGLQRLNYI